MCEPDECDTFQFMAKKLDMKVLHPGGLDATETLAKRAGISGDMIILDAGCGRGSSSILLAKHYGCRVVGIDLDHTLLVKAYAAARKVGVLDRVAFRLADMNDLPFQDDTFDGAIVQAALIFAEKRRALQMLLRKVRLQGFVGLVELAWKSSPTTHMIRRVGEVLCEAARNAEPHLGWVNLLRESGFSIVSAELHDLDFSFQGMLRNEGFMSTSKITLKSILDDSVTRKTQEVKSLFNEAREYLGYGIYVARKQLIDRGTAQHQDPRTLGYPDI